jgi:ATP-dependent DNA helicase RecG
MLSTPLQKYLTTANEKYINAIIKHLGNNEIGSLLFFLPNKYLYYKKGCIDEDFKDEIPIIFGEVTGIFKKNSAVFINAIDLNHKERKKFVVYFKNKNRIFIKIGSKQYFTGKISQKDNILYMFFPHYQSTPFSPYIRPVYDNIEGCPQEKLKGILKLILDTFPPIYLFFHKEKNLHKYSLGKILSMVHNTYYAVDNNQIRIGWGLLKICEYTCFFDGVHNIRKSFSGEAKLLKYKFDVPLTLTNCQITAMQSISKSLASIKPTISFLQGDVGSGKTLVAFCAVNKTLLNGFNSCFMAPTRILAHQHFLTYKNTFPNFNCFLVDSGYKSKKYLNELEEIFLFKKPTIFFGTHALLYEKLQNISFIVIDEQHKFSMEQRKILIDAFPRSDVLYLSATPIPRTLFMIKNNQMQLHTLKSTPFQKQIETILVKDRKEIIDKVFKLSKEEKILWINPAINENSENNSKIQSSVIKTYEDFKKQNIQVSFLHGQLKDEEKLEILKNFKKGILVSTICVETGINIENLNVIIIEEASRFGLATLHQLRGRVGRYGEKAQCILIENNETERLNILLETNDGFKIAEMDLQQRGFGSFFQKQQWGFDGFKTGPFNDNLFDLSRRIFEKKAYEVLEIQKLSKFFFKLQDVNY